MTASAWTAPSVIGFDRVSAAVPSRPYTPYYKEGFQGAVPGNADASWSTSLISAAPADPNRRYLGDFGNDTVTLKLQNIPVHDCLCIEFDLYLRRSWDGSHPRWGDDWVGVRLDGTVLMRDTFAMHSLPSFQQTFGPLALNPAGTGTSERDTLGDTSRWGDQVVPIELCDLTHTGSDAVFDFFGEGQEGVNNEGWGIDNLVVSYA